MKTLITLCSLSLLLASCNYNENPELSGSQQEMLQNPVKEKVIATFKTDMKVLTDSSIVYFDKAMLELEKGKKTGEVIEALGPSIKAFELKMSETTRAFSLEAQKLKMSEQEFNSVFGEVKNIVQPGLNKYQELKRRGFILNK